MTNPAATKPTSILRTFSAVNCPVLRAIKRDMNGKIYAKARELRNTHSTTEACTYAAQWFIPERREAAIDAWMAGRPLLAV